MIKIILCALNEAQNLEILIPSIVKEIEDLAQNYEIILCLDGSQDKSYNLILDFQKKYQIRTLALQNQRGLGLAYKRLFIESIKTANDDDIIISFDADNTHNPNQIKEIIATFKKEKADLIILSRFCHNSLTTGFPIYRRIISKTTSLILQNLFSVKNIYKKNILDYSSGYRGYLAKKLKDIYKDCGDNFITEKDFIYTCEILINIYRYNGKIVEIPLIYDYSKKIGETKLKFWKNALGLIKLIIKQKIIFLKL